MKKKLTLLSPEIVAFTATSIQAKISHEVFTSNKMGVKTPINHAVLIVSEKKADDKFELPVDPNTLFGKELIGQLTEIKSLVGDCAQLAERLFGQLKSVNDKLETLPELSQYFGEYNDRYSKLDFMGHRQIIGAIMKSGKNDCVNRSLDDYEPKSVRVALENFILDRNKYTHGDLLYWQKEKMTVLEYKNNLTHKPEFAIVNGKILNSFSDCYSSLAKIFSDITECLQ